MINSTQTKRHRSGADTSRISPHDRSIDKPGGDALRPDRSLPIDHIEDG